MGVALGLVLGAAGSAAAQALVIGVIAPLTGSKAEPGDAIQGKGRSWQSPT
jgi:hypothetical protein